MQGAWGFSTGLRPTKMPVEAWNHSGTPEWRTCLNFISFYIDLLRWDVANPRTIMPFPNNWFSYFSICTVFAICQLISSSTGHGDGMRWYLSIFLGSFRRPLPARCNWSVFARKMHSTSEFAKIVLSNFVRVWKCNLHTWMNHVMVPNVVPQQPWGATAGQIVQCRSFARSRTLWFLLEGTCVPWVLTCFPILCLTTDYSYGTMIMTDLWMILWYGYYTTYVAPGFSTISQPNTLPNIFYSIQIMNDFMIIAWARGFMQNYAGQYTNALKWGERALAAAGSDWDTGTLANSCKLGTPLNKPFGSLWSCNVSICCVLLC